jgi:hypothetical protein
MMEKYTLTSLHLHDVTDIRTEERLNIVAEVDEGTAGTVSTQDQTMDQDCPWEWATAL